MRTTRSALFLPAALLLAPMASAETLPQAKRTLNADGSTSMTYAADVSELGTELGLDMSAPARSVAPLPAGGAEALSGKAYAKVSLSDLPQWLIWQKGSVNVAVSPTEEESRVATSFSRSWTINDGLKATLADSYVMSRGSAGAGWETDKSLSLNVTETGTTLSVGAKATGGNAQLLPGVSARQNIVGNLSVTTSVADTGTELNRSITAGFTHRW